MDLTLILEPKPAGPEMISQWRDLPSELVDRLPEFIFFPGARTLRSVSQHWLMMLSPDEPSANPDVLDKDSVVECVCVFGDVGDLKCRLPPDLLVRTHHIVFPPGHDNLSVLSTSGGLICFGERHAESGRPPTLFVCNPATEMWRELPKVCLNEDDEEEEVHDVVCWFLVVDEVANFYAVWGADDFCDNCYLYDSREMCWWRVRGGPDSDAWFRGGFGDMVFYEGNVMHFIEYEIRNTKECSTASMDLDACAYNQMTFYHVFPSFESSQVIEHYGSLFCVGMDTSTRTCCVFLLDDQKNQTYWGERRWNLLGDTILDWLILPPPIPPPPTPLRTRLSRTKLSRTKLWVNAVGLGNYICITLSCYSPVDCSEVVAFNLHTRSWSRWSSDASPKFRVGYALKFTEGVDV